MTFRTKMRLATFLALVLAAPGAIAQELTLSPGQGGDVVLAWTGGAPTYHVFRSADPSKVVDPANELQATLGTSFYDTPPPGALWFYLVESEADCLRPTIDAHVLSKDPSGVFGAQDELELRLGNDAARSYLRFNLDGIPAGARIDQATLWGSSSPTWTR